MDSNKEAKLKQIGYRVVKCCGLCIHAEFPNNDWGTCSEFKYDHLKHTGEKRQLSITKFGSCPNFRESPDQSSKLGLFRQFQE